MNKTKIETKTRPTSETRTNAEAYREFMGRWSRLTARDFIEWIDIPSGKRWLDVGCGTGSLTQAILEMSSPELVRAIDPNDDYVNYARTLMGREPKVSFHTATHLALNSYMESFDAVVAGLVLNFIENRAEAIEAMKKVTVDGGTIGVYVWDYNGRMELLRFFWDAALELDPDISVYHESLRFRINDQDSLKELFRGAGLKNIESHAINITMQFRNFDDYWLPFYGGQGPAGLYFGSLNENKRNAIKRLIKERINAGSDGAFELVARAWAIKGIK